MNDDYGKFNRDDSLPPCAHCARKSLLLTKDRKLCMDCDTELTLNPKPIIHWLPLSEYTGGVVLLKSKYVGVETYFALSSDYREAWKNQEGHWRDSRGLIEPEWQPVMFITLPLGITKTKT